jgi:hypothetical protein
VTGIGAACYKSRASVRAPSDNEDAMRTFLDSVAARARPDSFEVCTGGGQAPFVVEVLDSITRKPAAWGAVLTWRAGRTVETAGPVGKFPMKTEDISGITGPYGRPGTYDLIVSKPGYRDWYRTGVKVEGTTEPQRGGRCTITKTVYLRALLQRAQRR